MKARISVEIMETSSTKNVATLCQRRISASFCEPREEVADAAAVLKSKGKAKAACSLCPATRRAAR